MGLILRLLLVFSIPVRFMLLGVYCSSVLDLSDTFPEVRKDGGFWLVKFFAPWCGHCKKLEPVWDQVGHSLAGSEIQVGRLDCNRFPSIAAEFGIRGYPTIKFITIDSDFTFTGDRNKDDIINFAVRLVGPPVQEITQLTNLLYIRNSNQIFFLYIGDQNDDLWKSFYYAATKLQPYCSFYSTTPEVAEENLEIEVVPRVLVQKENLTTFFIDEDSEPDHLNTTLYNWINIERFELFTKITRGNMNDILQTKKYVVMVVVEEKKSHRVPDHMMNFVIKVKDLVRNNREKYGERFQFGWVGSPELANSIATEVLTLPNILVINSTNYYHYIPDADVVEDMTAEEIELFLDKVYNLEITPRGGNGVLTRMYRTYFDSTTALADMWHGNPVLTIVLFGLPLTFLCFIIYSICCAEIIDSDDDDEDEDDDDDDDEEVHAKIE